MLETRRGAPGHLSLPLDSPPGPAAALARLSIWGHDGASLGCVLQLTWAHASGARAAISQSLPTQPRSFPRALTWPWLPAFAPPRRRPLFLIVCAATSPSAYISPHSVITHGSFGLLFCPAVCTASSLRTVSMLSASTRPNTTCLSSSHSAVARGKGERHEG